MGIKLQGGKFRGGFYGKFDGFKNIISLALYADPALAVKDGSDNFVSLQDKSFNAFSILPAAAGLTVKTFRGFPVIECAMTGAQATIRPIGAALPKLKFLSDGSPYSVFSVDYIETANVTAGTFWSPLQTRLTSVMLTGSRYNIGLRTGTNGRNIQQLIYNANTNVGNANSNNTQYNAAGECFISEWHSRGYLHAGNDLENYKNSVSIATANYLSAPDAGNPVRSQLYQLSGNLTTTRNFVLLAYDWTGKSDSQIDSDRAMVYALINEIYGTAIY